MVLRIHHFSFFLSLLFWAPLAKAHLEQVRSNRPLYELGLVGGAGYVPDYPASNQGRIRYLVAPVFRYRGFRFRSDEEDSARARMFLHPLYGLDLNATGSFPASSDKNEARKDMPDLNWMAEIGPRLYVFLFKSEKLWWRVFAPLRLAYSTDLLSATYQGVVFAPSSSVRYFFDDTKFNSIILGITRTYTGEKFQDYYFEVDKIFEAPGRPQYSATAGYLSTSAGLGFIHEKNNKGFYAGMGMNSYKGSANSGSPLHKSDYTYGAFLGFSYLFYGSEEKGYQ